MTKPCLIVSRVRAVSLALLLVAVPIVASAGPGQSAPLDNMAVGFKVGVGGGVPYGVFGAGIDIGIPHFSLVAGAGTALYGSFGWSAGVRVYFLDWANRFQPHLTAVYGTTLVVGNGPFEGETVNGFGFYAGLDHDIGPISGLILTYGVGLLTNEPPPFGVEDPRFFVKALFGINYRFGGQR